MTITAPAPSSSPFLSHSPWRAMMPLLADGTPVLDRYEPGPSPVAPAKVEEQATQPTLFDLAPYEKKASRAATAPVPGPVGVVLETASQA